MTGIGAVRSRLAAWSRAFAHHVRALRDEPLLILWTLFVVADPIYLFKSGLPQPADLVILIIAPLALSNWNRRLCGFSLGAMHALCAFLGYVLLSSLVWSLVADSWSLDYKHGFLSAPLFYVFDVVVFLTILVLYERFGERFVWLTVRLILISVCFQVAMTTIYTRSGTVRVYGLFNNSNQLAYYSILVASILLLGQHRARLSPIAVIVGELCCCYLILLSASRAGLASFAILMVVAVLNRFRTLIAIGAIATFLGFIFNPFESAIERSRTRLATDKSLSFIEERGYDRIARHPEYLGLGAGEGQYSRFEFTSAIKTHEIHSSIGTLVFCYGVVGFGVFVVFLQRVVRGASVRRILLLLPPAAYGLTHQGLRFTPFWVLLALVITLNDLDAREPRTQQPEKLT